MAYSRIQTVEWAIGDVAVYLASVHSDRRCRRPDPVCRRGPFDELWKVVANQYVTPALA
jgi:hypothetical protein